MWVLANRWTRRGVLAGLAAGALTAATLLGLDVAQAARTPALLASIEQPLSPASDFLLVHGDTVRGAAGLQGPEIPLLACVQANRFPQGSQIVFRTRVVDPDTGDFLDDAALDSVTITFMISSRFSTTPARFFLAERRRWFLLT